MVFYNLLISLVYKAYIHKICDCIRNKIFIISVAHWTKNIFYQYSKFTVREVYHIFTQWMQNKFIQILDDIMYNFSY
jgi:hypothetical protein